MAKKRGSNPSQRVAVAELDSGRLEQLRERLALFNSVSRRLFDFMHDDQGLKAEVRSASNHFFHGHKELPHVHDDQALEAALGRFSEWFLYERVSRSYRERPIDTFIARLPAGDERDFAASLRDNVLGTFAVRAVAPGIGVSVDELVSRRCFEVLERLGSRTFAPGAVLMGRLFPLDEEIWVLSGLMLVFNQPEVASALSEGLSKLPPDARIASQRVYESLLMGKSAEPDVIDTAPPASDLEARAAELLREAGLDADIEALRARMSRAEWPGDVFEELFEDAQFINEEQAQETAAALMQLWNTTPRPELGNRAPFDVRSPSDFGPQERRLLREFGRVVEREKLSSRYKTPKRRRAAIAKRQAEWMSTPRADLNGRTPAEVIEAERTASAKGPETTPEVAPPEPRALPPIEANRLQRLPVAARSEWLGGRFTAPYFITDPEPYKPAVVLWIELPAGVVVYADILEPGDPNVSLDSALARAMQRPMVGEPRRPRRVRVADASQARELDVLGSLVRVEVAPTPELEEVLQSLHSNLEGGEEPSYFESGRVAPQVVEDLFRAAEMLHLAAPWKSAADDQVLRVDIPQLDVRGACLSIIGAAGQSFGLVLFPSFEGFDAFCNAGLDSAEKDDIDLGTTYLALDFEHRTDLPESMQHEADENGWPVRAEDAYPVVHSRGRDGASRPLSERDVRIMSVCSMSLSTLLLRHPDMFDETFPLPLCESIVDGDDVEVRLTIPYEAGPLFAANDAPSNRREARIGRNEPCPCGSGEKYKRCHLGRPLSS